MENEIRGRLEELGLDQEQINELEPLLEEREIPEGELRAPVEDLKTQFSLETDWRKRAAIAARIISQHLEEGY